MRWDSIKEAFRLAKNAFNQDVWLQFPTRLSGEGRIPVFAIRDLSKPIGEMVYRFVPKGNQLRLLIEANGRQNDLLLKRSRPRSFKVAAREAKSIPYSLPLKKIAERYGEEAPALIEKLLETQGRRAVVQDAPRIVTAAQGYKQGDRVRIMAPTMDFGELGWIMDKPRKDKEGDRWYLVLVDGSSEPIEAHEAWLRLNAAGKTPDA